MQLKSKHLIIKVIIVISESKLNKVKMRKLFFRLFFTKEEQTAILNALWRRQNDSTTYETNGQMIHTMG